MIGFDELQRMRRFARFWDLIANSGNFVGTTPMIWGDQSPFASFMTLTDWLYQRTGRKHAIALRELTALLFEWLTSVQGKPAQAVGQTLGEDYQRGGRTDVPEILKAFVEPIRREAIVARAGPRRQELHRARSRGQ
jgi:hypothetical protein